MSLLAKRTAEAVGQGASDAKRSRAQEVDVSWLKSVLFGPEDETWALLERGDGDQATMLAIVKAAGLRVSLVANPRSGICIYTENDNAESVPGETC